MTPCTLLTLNDRFAVELGRDNTASVLKQLEQERPKLHRNELQKEYDSVLCSTLTKFLWTQAENKNPGNGFESIQNVQMGEEKPKSQKFVQRKCLLEDENCT